MRRDDHDRIACPFRGKAGYSPRRPTQPSSVRVEAHITGTVWKIEVAVGDEVDEGDTVVILESMKMEMPVEAEDPGTVKEIRCEEGQSVQEGDVLVVSEWPAPPRSSPGGKLVLDHPAEAVARLTISNPERRNALDHDILNALAEVMPSSTGGSRSAA